MWRRGLTPRRLLAGLALLMAGAGFGVVLFAWSGLYSVAASSGHWRLTAWFLRFGMENSVETHAPDVEPPRLDDEDLVRLGAGHFQSGCASCHRAPGMPANAVTAGMLPPPPDLAARVGRWSDQELFWIVKHGIKYAGMPAWPAQGRDDEVWALVAFLRRLPELDASGYRDLALGSVGLEEQDGRRLAQGEAATAGEIACARCHGSGDSGPLSRLVPRLHGQREAMLAGALADYAAGRRQSGIMQPIAASLSPNRIAALARYYAGLPKPAGSGRTPDPERVAAGRKIATEGDAASAAPACLACHRAGALATYPLLDGQNARYLLARLRFWKAGGVNATPADTIMAPIARRLSDEQAQAVAAYFESLAGDPAGSLTGAREAAP